MPGRQNFMYPYRPCAPGEISIMYPTAVCPHGDAIYKWTQKKISHVVECLVSIFIFWIAAM
jgi:hypothetical protein